jgi:hypothetical protein
MLHLHCALLRMPIALSLPLVQAFISLKTRRPRQAEEKWGKEGGREGVWGEVEVETETCNLQLTLLRHLTACPMYMPLRRRGVGTERWVERRRKMR